MITAALIVLFVTAEARQRWKTTWNVYENTVEEWNLIVSVSYSTPSISVPFTVLDHMLCCFIVSLPELDAGSTQFLLILMKADI